MIKDIEMFGGKLDEMLVKGESPCTVMEFIARCEDSAKAVLAYSRRVFRLFALDFVAGFSQAQHRQILTLIKDVAVEPRVGAYLCWQVLQSNLPEEVKHLYRTCVSGIEGVRHPYTDPIRGTSMPCYDSVFADAWRPISESVRIINELPVGCAEKFGAHLELSLWEKRFLEADVFGRLDADRQRVMLRQRISGPAGSDGSLEFVEAALGLGRSLAVKKEAYDALVWVAGPDSPGGLTEEQASLLEKCGSYAEFEIKRQLYDLGEIGMRNLVLHLLYNRQVKILKDIVRTHREQLQKSFDVCDLVENLPAKEIA